LSLLKVAANCRFRFAAFARTGTGDFFCLPCFEFGHAVARQRLPTPLNIFIATDGPCNHCLKSDAYDPIHRCQNGGLPAHGDTFGKLSGRIRYEFNCCTTIDLEDTRWQA